MVESTKENSKGLRETPRGLSFWVIGLVPCRSPNMAVKYTVCHGGLCVMLESAKENLNEPSQETAEALLMP